MSAAWDIGDVVTRSSDWPVDADEPTYRAGRLYEVIVIHGPFVGVRDVLTGEELGVTTNSATGEPLGNMLASGFRRPRLEEVREAELELERMRGRLEGITGEEVPR